MKARRILIIAAALLLSCLTCGYLVVTPSYREAQREYDEWLRKQDAGASDSPARLPAEQAPQSGE